MAKGNLLLGTASGKLGDVVFYRKQGTQLSRVRVRQVTNPQTLPQMISRVVLSTLTKAYSVLQPICDHAFQGLSSKAENMQRFMKLNSGILRKPIDTTVDSSGTLVWRVALLTNGGWRIIVDRTGNFSSYDNPAMLVNPLQISEGTAPAPTVDVMGGDGINIPFASVDWLSSMTYAQLCTQLGVPAGAQLTYVFGDYNDNFEVTSFNYARVVLRPADGDMSKPFYLAPTTQNPTGVNDPNDGNEVDFGHFTVGDDSIVYFTWDGVSSKLFGSVIVSWWDGVKWVRSSSYLHFAGDGVYNNLHMSSAIESYLTAVKSSKYLNQGDVE